MHGTSTLPDPMHAHYLWHVMVQVYTMYYRSWVKGHGASRRIVSSPDPTHYAGKGLLTFEGFLGCADSAIM